MTNTNNDSVFEDMLYKVAQECEDNNERIVRYLLCHPATPPRVFAMALLKLDYRAEFDWDSFDKVHSGKNFDPAFALAVVECLRKEKPKKSELDTFNDSLSAANSILSCIWMHKNSSDEIRIKLLEIGFDEPQIFGKPWECNEAFSSSLLAKMLDHENKKIRKKAKEMLDDIDDPIVELQVAALRKKKTAS